MDRLPRELEKYMKAATQAVFDIFAGGTDDPTLIELSVFIADNQARAAILAFLNAAERDGWRMVQTKGNVVLPEQAFGFLMGTDSLAGRWFGDDHVGRPKYWWRTEIRAMIDAAKEEGK